MARGLTAAQSDSSSFAAVFAHEGVAEQAEDAAGQAGPEPDAVIVVAEPGPERQQHDEGEEPQYGSGQDHSPRADLDGRWSGELA